MSMPALVVVAALLNALVAAVSALSDSVDLSWELHSHDECLVAGSGNGCALNALQRRGAKVVPEQTSQAKSSGATLWRSQTLSRARQKKKLREPVRWPTPIHAAPALQDQDKDASIIEWSSSQGVCIDDKDALPTRWRPTPQQQAALTELSPRRNLQHAASAAAHVAWNEIVEFLNQPRMIQEQADEALEAVLDMAYGTGKKSTVADVSKAAFHLAADIVVQLGKRYEDRAGTCDGMKRLPLLLPFSYDLQQRLSPNKTLDATQVQLESFTNEALADCGDLDTLLGFNPSERLGAYPKTDEQAIEEADGLLYDMLMQAVDLIGLLTIPNLKMPKGTLEYVADFWKYLFKYPFPNGAELVVQDNMWPYVDVAYFLSHTVYFASGFGRYRLKVRDAPWLFKWVRENFYNTLATGHLELIGESVDALRHYDCTTHNDVQLRDGLNVLLDMYKQSGKSWIKQKDWTDTPTTDTEEDDYNMMHKPWAVYGALHHHANEKSDSSSYGAIFKKVSALAQSSI